VYQKAQKNHEAQNFKNCKRARSNVQTGHATKVREQGGELGIFGFKKVNFSE